jgi:hypothetical protein
MSTEDDVDLDETGALSYHTSWGLIGPVQRTG